MSKQIHIYGPCAGPEGYAEVVRGLTVALDRAGWNVLLEPFVQWGPWRVKLDPEVEKVITRCTQNTLYPQASPLLHLHVCLPEQVRPVESHVNVNLTMFEADRVPQNWVECARILDCMVVPNEFCRRTFSTSGIPKEKLVVSPLGYDPQVFNVEVPPLPIDDRGVLLRDRFPVRVMSILEVTNRKNFEGLLWLFFKAASTVGPEKCCLILKAANYTNFVSITDRIKAIRDHMVEKKLIVDQKYHVFNYAPLVPCSEMGSFMRTATHYLSASLAEGWDLNAMNAMACGIPVIVPNHSGYTSYCTFENACLLPVSVRVAAAQGGSLSRLYHEAAWFGIDADESAPILADYLADTGEAMDRATQAHQDVQELTWNHAAHELIVNIP